MVLHLLLQIFQYQEVQNTHNSEIRNMNFQAGAGLEPDIASPQTNKYHMYTLSQKGDSLLEKQAIRHCNAIIMPLRETLVPVANLNQDRPADLIHDYRSRMSGDQFLGKDLP